MTAPGSLDAFAAALLRAAETLDGLAAATRADGGLAVAAGAGWEGLAAAAAATFTASLGLASAGVATCCRGPAATVRRAADDLAGAAVGATPGGPPVPGGQAQDAHVRVVVTAAGLRSQGHARALPHLGEQSRSGWLAPFAALPGLAGAAATDAGAHLGLEVDRLRSAGDEVVLTRLAALAGRPATVRLVAARIGPERLARLASRAPRLLGGLDGVPWRTRVAANRVVLAEAEAEARTRGDVVRAEVLAGLARDPARQLLLVEEAGDGRVVEVWGDLDTAASVAVVVPGIASTLATYDEGLAPRAARIWGATRVLPDGPDGSGGAAVVAWLGYDAPGLVDAPLAGASVVALVLLGSPGVGVATAADLGLAQGTVFAGRAPGDAVSWSENFGRDPTDPRFGAVRLATGDARGHSSYLDEGTVSLRGVAAVAAGHPDLAVTEDPGVVERAVAAADEVARAREDATVDALQRAADHLLARPEAVVPLLRPAHEMVDRAVDLRQRLGGLDLHRDVVDDAARLLRPPLRSEP